MSVNVYIPTPFRHLVGNRANVKARGATISDVLADLDTQFPGFRAQVVDSRGERAPHINIYVNQVEIENLQGESTRLSDGDEVAVIPALAGGAAVPWYSPLLHEYPAASSGSSAHMIVPLDRLSPEAAAVIRQSPTSQLLADHIVPVLVDSKGSASVSDGTHASHVAWPNVYSRRSDYPNTTQEVNSEGLDRLRSRLGMRSQEIKINDAEGARSLIDALNAVWPVAKPPTVMTPEMVERYSRHLIMPQVGSAGQRKIIEAKVLMIGAGGLGSPVALYLALAGVGTIGIVDFDVVDRSNLQRQILHQTDDIGKPKVQSASETLMAHNPNINVVTHEAPITSDNAFEIISQYDIVVNGADNFATRYLVNDACYLLKKPLVDGSILMFDGQATTYLPGKGCYRCLYPAPPPPGLVPSCAEAGVLGAMCSTIGSIQATEVLKLVLEVGEPLVNRLLLYDALSLEFRIVKVRRDPECPLCGDNPTISELIDYEQFCGAPIPHRDAPTGG